MDLFHEIPDALAITRNKGTFKQAKVYHRAARIYIAANGGFVRVCAKLGDYWVTSSPNLTVIDISQDVPGLSTTAEPSYKAPRKEWK